MRQDRERKQNKYIPSAVTLASNSPPHSSAVWPPQDPPSHPSESQYGETIFEGHCPKNKPFFLVPFSSFFLSHWLEYIRFFCCCCSSSSCHDILSIFLEKRPVIEISPSNREWTGWCSSRKENSSQFSSYGMLYKRQDQYYIGVESWNIGEFRLNISRSVTIRFIYPPLEKQQQKNCRQKQPNLAFCRLNIFQLLFILLFV